MVRRSLPAAIALFALLLTTSAFAADTYQVDPVHSSNAFRLKHANDASFWGRFNAMAGTIAVDEAEPTKDMFDVTIDVKALDTNNPKRDSDLKSPGFFSVEE